MDGLVEQWCMIVKVMSTGLLVLHIITQSDSCLIKPCRGERSNKSSHRYSVPYLEWWNHWWQNCIRTPLSNWLPLIRKIYLPKTSSFQLLYLVENFEYINNNNLMHDGIIIRSFSLQKWGLFHENGTQLIYLYLGDASHTT